MAKVRTRFVCRSCGSVQPKWMGRCPDCHEWDSLVEETLTPVSEDFRERLTLTSQPPQPITDIQPAPQPRVVVGLGEFDRVLGGGLVVGSAVLVGGDPGIGKSTLMLQACAALARGGSNCLYVTSEESLQQTRLRAQRLDCRHERLFVLAETSLELIKGHLRSLAPVLVVIDSIQMITKASIPTAPGSVTQLRECSGELVYVAKATGAAVVLVGHVTKSGAIAGPRLLEHLVDTVLYFEGDRFVRYRILRAVKNRFGSTNELGIFEMTDGGLVEVDNPSRLFLADRRRTVPGAAIVPAVEGTRTLLVEVQALTAASYLGGAKRKVSGADPGRVAMIIAVLEKHGGLALRDQDVFVSAAGGLRIAEPAADLALALAVAGAHTSRTLPAGTVAVGEVALCGEVRPVSQTEARLAEAARLGFARAVVPAAMPLRGGSIEPIPVHNIEEALAQLTP
jgi:DNA repair protein RadA/Sms